MRFQHHATLTLDALRRWFVAQCYDSMAVGGLWFLALVWLRVPWAPFWAAMAAILQFIPHFGPLFTLVGPSVAMAFTGASRERWLWLLGAYALIAAFDGLALQPYLMKRQNRVPFWASLLVPLVLGFLIPFWGVLLAPPLLAVVYAYRGAGKKEVAVREQKFGEQDQGIILPPNRAGDE